MQDCPKTPLKSDAHFTDNRSLQSPVSPFPQSPPPPPSEIDFNLLSKIDPNDPIGIVNALRMQEMALGKPDPLLPKTRPCTTEVRECVYRRVKVGGYTWGQGALVAYRPSSLTPFLKTSFFRNKSSHFTPHFAPRSRARRGPTTGEKTRPFVRS